MQIRIFASDEIYGTIHNYKLYIFTSLEYIFKYQIHNYARMFVTYKFFYDQITQENTKDFFLAESVVESLTCRMI